MQTDSQIISPGRLWTGRIVTTLAALFLLMDGVMKLLKPRFVIDATIQLGYPTSIILVLGIVLTASTILYVIPRTAVLGAILLIGYLGGEVASHARQDAGLFPVSFPVIIGVLVWLGIFLRDRRLQSLLPLRTVHGR
jgi:hypothetical protein